MRTRSKKTKFHLNGNTSWVMICVFLTGQTISGLISMGKITATVQQLDKKIDSLSTTVRENRNEAREDIKSLEAQLNAFRAIRKSA